MQTLSSIISSHISTLYGDISFFPTLSAPPKAEHGEYCFGVFTLAKPLGKAPNIIAEEIATRLREDSAHFTQVNVIGGYVNLSCTTKVWMNILPQVSDQKPKIKNNQTIVVDYIGANAGKPLHIGHICTPSVGQSICNIYRHLGYNVIGDSHFGDWGGIFGQIIWAWKNFLDSQTIGELIEELISKFSLDRDSDKNLSSKITEAIEKDDKGMVANLYLDRITINDIVLFYQKFHAPLVTLGNGEININKELELSNREKGARLEFQYLSGIGIDLSNPDELKHHKDNVDLWKKFTAISLAGIEKKLDLLNVHATYNIGESFYEGLNLPRPNNEDYPDLEYNMKDIVRELIEKGVAIQNEDGSVGVVFPEETKIPSCVLQKKDGTGLYLTSDLAAIKYRMTNGWNPSKIIYCIDVRQQLHIKQAVWIAKQAWGLEGVELFHAFNGFIKLKEGAMSTRHGTVIFLENLITEGSERTAALLAEKGRIGNNALSSSDIQAITISAIKYSYLSQDREKDVTFDWDKALSFEGNSGPYIQYACVRAGKIIKDEKIKTQHLDTKNLESGVLSFSVFDTALIRTLAEMESKIQSSADTYKPHTLALYCYDLAVCFNSFYVHTPKILEETNTDLKILRLHLCRLVAERLTLGFDLLGIKMPSEM